MLEYQASLRTWRLARPADSAGPIPAQPLADHRVAYLDYEGPISGDRGSVSRWDAGDYEWVADRPEELEFLLRGGRLCGRATLRRAADSEGWVFLWDRHVMNT